MIILTCVSSMLKRKDQTQRYPKEQTIKFSTKCYNKWSIEVQKQAMLAVIQIRTIHLLFCLKLRAFKCRQHYTTP